MTFQRMTRDLDTPVLQQMRLVSLIQSSQRCGTILGTAIYSQNHSKDMSRQYVFYFLLMTVKKIEKHLTLIVH